MAKDFRRADRDQQFLLPVDMREWLPDDHVVWALLEVVDRLDISGLEARYALGGAGRAAYDPRMLLALLIYAYSDGIRSSRQIERLCGTDVAMRVITGMQVPDHTVIARFRQRHQDSVRELFTQVLLVCAKAGLDGWARSRSTAPRSLRARPGMPAAAGSGCSSRSMRSSPGLPRKTPPRTPPARARRAGSCGGGGTVSNGCGGRWPRSSPRRLPAGWTRSLRLRGSGSSSRPPGRAVTMRAPARPGPIRRRSPRRGCRRPGTGWSGRRQPSARRSR